MFMREGDIISEPYIPVHKTPNETAASGDPAETTKLILTTNHDCYPDGTADAKNNPGYSATLPTKEAFDAVLVDFYHKHISAAK